MINLISFCDKIPRLADKDKTVAVIWILVKHLTLFPTVSPGEHGCSWFGQVYSSLGEELAEESQCAEFNVVGGQSSVVSFRAQSQGQFCLTFSSKIWMRGLKAPSVSFQMMPS